MPTEFDAEDGVLQLSHAALAVLATLAVDPTAPTLRDHGVAAPLAELRRAGIVGARGIHPAVEPLAAVMGRPSVRIRLTASDRGAVYRLRAWVGDDLAVVALTGEDQRDTYDLMADAPEMLPALLVELVGSSSVEPVVAGVRRVGAAALTALLDRGPAATVADAADLLGDPPDEHWAAALQAAVADASLRWTITVSGADAEDPESVDVIDAGPFGLWTAEHDDDGTAVVRATTAPEIHAVLVHLIRSRR